MTILFSTKTPITLPLIGQSQPPNPVPIEANPELLHEKLLPLYICYVTRITEHYKLGLQQFQIYFGFNAGLFALLGFILKPFFDAKLAPSTTIPLVFPPFIFLLFIGASLIGLVLTGHWRTVMRNSMVLQLHSNETLEMWERRLLRSADDGFYTRLNVLYPPKQHPKDDVIDVNVRVTWVFTWVWIIVAITSSTALLWPTIEPILKKKGWI